MRKIVLICHDCSYREDKCTLITSVLPTATDDEVVKLLKYCPVDGSKVQWIIKKEE